MKFSSLTPREQDAVRAWDASLEARKGMASRPGARIVDPQSSEGVDTILLAAMRAVIASADRTREGLSEETQAWLIRELPRWETSECRRAQSLREIVRVCCKAPPVETREQACPGCHGTGSARTSWASQAGAQVCGMCKGDGRHNAETREAKP